MNFMSNGSSERNSPMFMNDFMLRMRDRRAKIKGKREFKQAAFAYMGLKVANIVLTYIFVSCNGCGNTQLLKQGIHLLLFSHFIYVGMRITSSIISLICLIRGTAYLINFFFKTTYFLYLPVIGTNIMVLQEEGATNWVFLVNTLLMYSISIMIFRAVRVGLKKGRLPGFEVADLTPRKEERCG